MKLAIGTAQFGMNYGIANSNGMVKQLDISNILKLAHNNQIKFIDTAMAYGSSEASLGVSGIDQFNVITKLSAVPENVNDIKGWVVDSFENSLKNLNVDSIYALLLHRPLEILGNKGVEILDGLNELKESGKLQKLGVSISSPNECKDLFNAFDFDIVQSPFNIIDQRLIRSGWLKKFNSRGIEVHARSIFLQGLLLLEKDQIPSQFLKWKNLWEIWHKWLVINNINPVHACLSFALSHKKIDKIVLGIDTKAQLEQILNYYFDEKDLIFPDISTDSRYLINPAEWSVK